MRPSTASAGVVVLVAALWSVLATAQAPPARVIRITAVVTAGGAPVRHLQPADLEIVEDGRPQTIETATARSGRRLFAFLLDEFHVSAGASTARVREALDRFVTDELRADDLVAVLRPMEPVTAIHFTDDRDAVRREVASFEGRKGDLAPRTGAEAELLGDSPALVEAARARIVTTGLQELTAQMAGLEQGHGAVVLVSEGFKPPPGRTRRRLPDLLTVIRVSAHLDVPIYCLAPRAGQPRPAGDDAQGSEGEEDEGLVVLRNLAERTGGRATLTGGDLEAGLRRVARDLDASWVLTYRSAGENDGRYRTLDVRATRADVDVRTRPGYWAPLGDPVPPAEPGPGFSALAMSRRTRPVHRSPFAETWVGMSRGSDGRTRVAVTWEPNRGPAWSRGGARPTLARLKAARPDGDVVFEGRIVPAFAGRQGTPAAIFEAAPGPLEIDLTLVAEDGSVLDVDSRDVDVAALDGTRARLMEPEVVRARSAREFRDASADPDAAPTPSREFRRTERLLIRAPAYDADGTTLRVRARLLNVLGQPMRDLAPLADPTRDGITQFDVPLAPFAPGEYAISLTATGATGQVGTRIRFRVTG